MGLGFSEIVRLPEKVKQQYKKNEGLNSLISKETISKYDCNLIRLKLIRCVKKYKDKQYLFKENYDVANEQLITSVYGNGTIGEKTFTDKIGECIMASVDSKVWVQKFYEIILEIAPKLTRDEVIYFVECIYKGTSEESIVGKLNVGRNKLKYHVKPSCLIKIWWMAKDVIEEEFE